MATIILVSGIFALGTGNAAVAFFLFSVAASIIIVRKGSK
jgi:hypothetical protein